MTSGCTVIVPTHDRRERLLRTLATIRAQDHPDLEVVVSDDGSRDGTAEAVAALGDPRVRVVRNDVATGVANARNRGLEASSTPYVAFCDDDDLWHPRKVGAQLEEMRKEGRRWSYCNAILVTDELAPIAVQYSDPRFMVARLADYNSVPGGCSSVVAERELVRDVGAFDPAFQMLADWDLWIRLAARQAPAAWTGLGVLYVQHGAQMTTDTALARDELTRLRDKHAAFRDAAPISLAIETVDEWVAGHMWKGGDRLAAVAHVARSLDLRHRGAPLSLARMALKPLRSKEIPLFWRDEVDGVIADVASTVEDGARR